MTAQFVCSIFLEFAVRSFVPSVRKNVCIFTNGSTEDDMISIFNFKSFISVICIGFFAIEQEGKEGDTEKFQSKQFQ